MSDAVMPSTSTQMLAPTYPRRKGGVNRQRLLEAAEQIYAERGLDGASVRMVIERANARLGSITENFGSLGALPRAVIEQRHAALLAAREKRLSTTRERDLCSVVEAYSIPLIELSSEDSGWKSYSRVWAQLVSGFSWDKKLGFIIDADAERFIALIAQAEPQLSEEQTQWAFMLMMGAVSGVCADNGRIDRLSNDRYSSSDLLAIMKQLIPYVVGGIRALGGDGAGSNFNDLPVARRRSKEKRDLLLDSAERMFAAHGFFGTSFRTIAKSSGLSVGLLQHYFDNKERLFRETLLRRYTPIQEQRELLLGAASSLASGPAKLRAIYSAWLEPSARHLARGGRGWRDHSRMMTTAINSQGAHWLNALDASHTEVTREMVQAAAESAPGMTLDKAYHAHLFMIGALPICYATEDRLRRISAGSIDPSDYRRAYSRLLDFHVGGSLALADLLDGSRGIR